MPALDTTRRAPTLGLGPARAGGALGAEGRPALGWVAVPALEKLTAPTRRSLAFVVVTEAVGEAPTPTFEAPASTGFAAMPENSCAASVEATARGT